MPLSLAQCLRRLDAETTERLLVVGAVLVVVSALACLAPAWRATAVDPVRVLKAE